MHDKLYLTIDSDDLDAVPPEHIVLPLENCGLETYTRIALKRVYLQHPSDVRLLFRFSGFMKPIYIHCSLLNNEDNLLNGYKSDVIAIIYPEQRRTLTVSEKFGNNSFKLAKPDNKIRMSLTCVDGIPVDNRIRFSVIYELEFSR